MAQQGEQDPVDGLMLADDGLADLMADGEESIAQFVVAVAELVLGRQPLMESWLSRARGGGQLFVSRNLSVRLARHLSVRLARHLSVRLARHLSVRLARNLSVRLARHLPGGWRGRVPRLAGLLAMQLARHLPVGWRMLRRQRRLAGLDPRLAADGPELRAARPARLAARPERTSMLFRLLRMVGNVGHVGETSLSMAVMRTAMSESCRS
ncbi:hypothetical protein M3B11_01955 [Brevibacterium sp. p3-SID960]|uniref:hypothetical protein n=1 Tax=Brevibacterium sp. p3-SID960 TaxID=2916063 RepID=UPI0021A8DD22|nr:hypothetical protein [Brevibacterium sp. p3-SID960]MCT1689731.1 hypothetical protein [Brevibacterium sp. p3-SID960]